MDRISNRSRTIAFALAAVFCLPSVPRAGSSKIDSSAIRGHFEGKVRTLRPTTFSSESYYLNGDRHAPYYSYIGEYIAAPSVVIVGKPHLARNELRLPVVPQDKLALGGEIVVRWGVASKTPPQTIDMINLLETAFLPEDGSDKMQGLILNTKSNMVHYVGSNHLPPSSHRQAVASAGTAQRCPICFPSRQRVGPGDSREYLIARTAYLEVPHTYRLIPEKGPQERVRAIGTKILEAWPRPLVGYNYDYFIYDDGAMNAFAQPTGLIYVSNSLLSTLESDAELEVILAHEIAHVEAHHGLRHSIAREAAINSARTGAAFLAIAAGVAAGINSNSAAIGAGAASAVALSVFDLLKLAAHQAASGYSRELEIEADNLAHEYLFKTGGAAKADLAVVVLSKFDYASGPSAAPNHWLSLHPAIAERVAALEETQFIQNGAASYSGDDIKRGHIAELNLSRMYIRKSDDQMMLNIDGALALATISPFQIESNQAVVDLKFPDESLGYTCMQKEPIVRVAGKYHLHFQCTLKSDAATDWPTSVVLRKSNGESFDEFALTRNKP
jgi:Zn-dependent protease with chaperone function